MGQNLGVSPNNPTELKGKKVDIHNPRRKSGNFQKHRGKKPQNGWEKGTLGDMVNMHNKLPRTEANTHTQGRLARPRWKQSGRGQQSQRREKNKDRSGR